MAANSITLEYDGNKTDLEYYFYKLNDGALSMSLVPRPSGEEEKAWGLLRAHARKLPFIFRRKISSNDVIVHGESSQKEFADIARV